MLQWQACTAASACDHHIVALHANIQAPAGRLTHERSCKPDGGGGLILDRPVFPIPPPPPHTQTLSSKQADGTDSSLCISYIGGLDMEQDSDVLASYGWCFNAYESMSIHCPSKLLWYRLGLFLRAID